MFIAYNKNHERVYIDDAIRKEEYFCPTCGDNLCVKKGNIKAHHFAHLHRTSCDGWSSDMSDWHFDWQKQFPIDNQEVVLELDGEKHRADVFINDTVIEFQHSKISVSEFEDRNDFYTKLGYKVIWIFDTRNAYEKHFIHSKIDEENFVWENPIVSLPKYDRNKIDVYLQEYDNIWKSHLDYKTANLKNDDICDFSFLHHIDAFNVVTLGTFCSYDGLYDFEFIDKFVPVNFLHNGSYDKNLKLKKLIFSEENVSDEILTYEDIRNERRKYVYCPWMDTFVNTCDKCETCQFCYNFKRCRYRFIELLSKDIDRLVDVKYSDEGKVQSVLLIKDGQRYNINYKLLPQSVFTIKEAFELFKDTQAIIVENINTGWKFQLNHYNYIILRHSGRCFGKGQNPKYYSKHFSKQDFEIFSHNKKEWILLWRK